MTLLAQDMLPGGLTLGGLAALGATALWVLVWLTRDGNKTRQDTLERVTTANKDNDITTAQMAKDAMAFMSQTHIDTSKLLADNNTKLMEFIDKQMTKPPTETKT